MLKRPRHPDRALVGRAGRGALPVVRGRRSRVGAARARGRRAARAARRCRRSRARRSARGAELVRARARAGRRRGRARRRRTLEGDRSCGAAAAGSRSSSPSSSTLRVTRQELFFFDGGPAWGTRPAWVDYDRAIYGTGDLDGLGVKVAWDQEGPPLDPDADAPGGDSPEIEALDPRLPRRPLPGARRGAPDGLEACRYEISPDCHFIAAPHPEHDARLDRRRRLRARLQARPGDGRADRERLGRRRAAPAPLRARRARARARRSGPRARTSDGDEPRAVVQHLAPPISSASPAAVNQRL